MDIINVNEENFDEEVLKSDKTVVVDFWAVWCGPCKMLAPLIDKVANEKNECKFTKVNIDEEASLVQKYNITAVPTLIVFKDGKEFKRHTGLLSEGELLELLN